MRRVKDMSRFLASYVPPSFCHGPRACCASRCSTCARSSGGSDLLGWIGVFRRLWQKIKALWVRAQNERATPREVFWAVFLGAFIGCTPAVGLRPWIALAAATVLKMNRLFCYLGSHPTSNIVVMPFVALAEVQIAHRIRVGQWAQIDRNNAADQAGEFLLDWCIGTIPVGLVLATLLGLCGYALAKRRDRRRAKALLSAPPPAEAPPPSSESHA